MEWVFEEELEFVKEYVEVPWFNFVRPFLKKEDNLKGLRMAGPTLEETTHNILLNYSL